MPPRVSAAAAAEKRAEQQDKAKEVAYVRSEKQADAAALARLAEAYGGGPQRTDRDVRRRVWTCAECQFRNVDVRDVCGSCLAPNPAVLSDGKRQRNDLIPARASLDPSTRIVAVAGRSYRCFAAAAVAPATGSHRAQSHSQAAKTGAAHDDDGEDGDDEPHCGYSGARGGSGEPATAGADDGDAAHGGDANDGSGAAFDPASGAFVLRLPVPRQFIKIIIGVKGATIRGIERLTGATLVVSGGGDNTGSGVSPATRAAATDGNESVEIRGPTSAAVHAARLRVEAVITDSAESVDYTHFLSVPLATSPTARGAFAALLQDMARTCADEERRIDPFMFQAPARLHLTLLMLRLYSQEELARAESLLVVVQEMLRELFTASDRINFSGVNVFTDNPTESHVAYLDLARDATSRKLIELIRRINALFLDAGLALPKDVASNEALHATVINSKWRSGAIADATAEHFADHHGGSAAARFGPRVAFDASEVLRLFGTLRHLPPVKLERVDLSVLGNARAAAATGAATASDGYFARVVSAYFP